MALSRELARTSYAPANQCIYCGATDHLGREHIIPAGLGGVATLPRSSCPDCARVTGEFERRVLRGPLWPVRIIRRIRSRRPSEAPKTFPLLLHREGATETVHLPPYEYPVTLIVPIFPLPAVLTSEGQVRGIRVTTRRVISFGPNRK